MHVRVIDTPTHRVGLYNKYDTFNVWIGPNLHIYDAVIMISMTVAIARCMQGHTASDKARKYQEATQTVNHKNHLISTAVKLWSAMAHSLPQTA